MRQYLIFMDFRLRGNDDPVSMTLSKKILEYLYDG